MSSWHLGKVATTSRERCGGQGYLSINRFGDMFGSAHAGMTAEGDNSVLMQKVAKEHLVLFKGHSLSALDKVDLEKPEHIMHLFKQRENMQHKELQTKISKAILYTMVGTLHYFIFTWMCFLDTFWRHFGHIETLGR